MHQQNVDSPFLTILDDSAQIDKAPLSVFLRRPVFVDEVVILRIRNGNDALRALFPIIYRMDILACQFAPAGMILAERKQVLPFHIGIGNAAVVHRVGSSIRSSSAAILSG